MTTDELVRYFETLPISDQREIKTNIMYKNESEAERQIMSKMEVSYRDTVVLIEYFKRKNGKMTPPSYMRKPSTPPVPTCPKCGSTQIQVLRKKWSFMRGFATNDVERVCVNCKNRF